MNGLEAITKFLFNIEEDAPIGQDKMDKVQIALEKLPARDHAIITKRYGIGQDRQHTLQELADEFGTDKEEIRLSENRILQSLKRQIK